MTICPHCSQEHDSTGCPNVGITYHPSKYIPHTCPKCNGWKTTMADSATHINMVECPVCDGTGVVWEML